MPKIYRVKTIIGLNVELELVEKTRDTAVFKDIETGNIYKVTVRKTSEGKYILNINGVDYIVHTKPDLGVFVNLTPLSVQEILPEIIRLEEKREEKREREVTRVDIGVLQAPISGRVIEVVVKPGQVVNEGNTVVLMESMKMVVEVKSHVNGVVEEIYVNPGAVVKRGDRLLKIKPL